MAEHRIMSAGDLLATVSGRRTCDNIKVGCAGVLPAEGGKCPRCGYDNAPPPPEGARPAWLSWLPKSTNFGGKQ